MKGIERNLKNKNDDKKTPDHVDILLQLTVRVVQVLGFQSQSNIKW